VVPLKTRILLADDHAMVRRGLRMVLDAEPDLEVVDEASDGAEALERTLKGDVDLAILDVTMPRMTGLQAARELRRRGSEAKVLVLYVLKSAAHKDLVEAARAAMRGEPFLYPGAITALIKDFLTHAHEGGPDRENPLTPREEEVTKLIAEGHTSKEIAALLVLSEKTVERHRANILEKLGLRDRVDLTRYAIRRGLIDP
jgi:DNA-binding NarL/FixJ family response regulator